MGVTVLKGEIAELKVKIRAAERGILVLMPTTEARYDLVLEEHGTFTRVQVKYCDSEDPDSPGTYILKLNGTKRSHRAVRPYSKEEIDLILVYLPVRDLVIALGPSLFDGKKNVSVRVTPPETRTRKDQRFASDLIW